MNSHFVKIWFTDLRKSKLNKDLTERYLAILDKPERARYDQLTLPVHKLRFLLGRSLLRTLLADCLKTPPQNIELSTSLLGRPEFVQKNSPFSFNLAHSKDLIICVVASNLVGIDLENTTKKRNYLEIAEHYFTKADYKELQGLAPEKRVERFYYLWTLKEAYLKSKGESVFSLNPNYDFGKDKNYSFITFQPQENYICSVAMLGDYLRNIKNKITIEEVIPLVSRYSKEPQILEVSSASLK